MMFINIADLTDPETGKTYRQLNNEKTHKLKLGMLVEIKSEEWAKLGGEIDTVNSLSKYVHPDMSGYLDLSPVGLEWVFDKYTIAIITTRSQFRSLMTGLGIEPQKKIGKKIK